MEIQDFENIGFLEIQDFENTQFWKFKILKILDYFRLDFFWIFIELDPKVFDPFAQKIF